MIDDPRDGGTPKLPRPLRSEPVRRDEVRLVWRYSRIDEVHYPQQLTMPLGTYSRGVRFEYYVGDPVLWQPVLDELAREFEARYQADLARYAEMLSLASERQPALLPIVRQMAPRRQFVPQPEISIYSAREFLCLHCGRPFLARPLPRNRPVLCSDKCEHAYRAGQQHGWRKAHPAKVRKYRGKRTQQRAEARAGRACECCGSPFEAARSTRRFCSDACRVRAHRS